VQPVKQLKAKNLELAAANLAAAEEQADKRNQVAIIRSSEYAPAKAAFDAQWARQQAVLSKLSPEVLLRRWAGPCIVQEGLNEWHGCEDPCMGLCCCNCPLALLHSPAEIVLTCLCLFGAGCRRV
jgi:hypothetical protein